MRREERVGSEGVRREGTVIGEGIVGRFTGLGFDYGHRANTLDRLAHDKN